MTDHVQIQVVHDDRDALTAIVDDLLAHRLVACGQILGPVRSRYRWRGRVESAEEWLLLLKTRSPLAAAVVERVRGLHAYEVPEVLVLPVLGGHPAYLAWLDAETER